MSELYSAHRYRRFYKGYSQFFKNTAMQAYTMVALSLFAISFFGAFAIRPTLKTIAVLKRQITDRLEVNDKLEQKINTLVSAQEEYKNAEKDLPLIYSLLPETARFPSLFRKIEYLTVTNGATISGVQFDPVILYTEEAQTTPSPSEGATQELNTKDSLPQETTSQVPLTPEDIQTTPIFFTLTLLGPYQNLVSLLDTLTGLDRLITITSVELTGNQEDIGPAKLSIFIQSHAHYFPGNN